MTMNKDLEFLAELQKEMREGKHDGQAFPRFWVIRDYRKIQTTAEAATFTEIYLVNEDTHGLIMDVLAFMMDTYDYDRSEYNIPDEAAAVRWLKNNIDSEAYLAYYDYETYVVPDTFFITKDEAKQHLESYGYNYGPRAHTYAMTALRAPKVEKLFSILRDMDFSKLEEKGGELI